MVNLKKSQQASQEIDTVMDDASTFDATKELLKELNGIPDQR